ncbi:MAG: VOC family protein [Pseudomonadota bacterium]
MPNSNEPPRLDTIHHVAIEVDDVPTSLRWYQETFACQTEYEDSTWALLKFGNMSLALVTKGQHPPHIAFVTEKAASFGELKAHRDGTRSVYIKDPTGNAVELLDPDSIVHEQSK